MMMMMMMMMMITARRMPSPCALSRRPSPNASHFMGFYPILWDFIPLCPLHPCFLPPLRAIALSSFPSAPPRVFALDPLPPLPLPSFPACLPSSVITPSSLVGSRPATNRLPEGKSPTRIICRSIKHTPARGLFPARFPDFQGPCKTPTPAAGRASLGGRGGPRQDAGARKVKNEEP